MHQHNRHYPDDHHDHDHHGHEYRHEQPVSWTKRLGARWRWAAALILLILCWCTFYTVRETEFVLVTQLGQPLYNVSDAGLHIKWFFQTANYFDRRLHLY
ncbi:MAG: hypothetical protein ACRD7E_15765, partial [Bryobacteraceae bacterium]